MNRATGTGGSRIGCDSSPGPARHRTFPSSLLSCLVVGVLAVACPARETHAAERAATGVDEVKAAFLYKFAGYVEWPPDSFAQSGVPFTIAVVGAEPLATELREVVKERTVHDRPIEVRRLESGEPLAGVHMLFVGEDQHARLEELVRTAQPRSILTVTEFEGALEAGSVINFVVSERRVRFEISIDSAEKSRLRLSSRLLEVAQRVLPGTG